MKAGDKIRNTRFFEGTRINGALDMTLEYYGRNHVVYSWKNPNNGLSGGESYMRRTEFDAEHETVPEVFEEGKSYQRSGAKVYKCLYADDRVGFMSWEDDGDTYYGHLGHVQRKHYTEVES